MVGMPMNPQEGVMSDDWQAGDLALCIKLGKWRGDVTGRPIAGPAAGRIYTVTWAGMAGGIICLELEGVETYLNSNGAVAPWRAYRFRKIRPHLPVSG